MATPTGSTAYNLSAGGPFVQPTAKNLVVTAVCPHSVAARSIVTAEEDEVQLTVEMGEGQQAPVLVIDGSPHCRLCPGDCVQVRRSRQQLKIVRLPGQEPAQSKLFQ